MSAPSAAHPRRRRVRLRRRRCEAEASDLAVEVATLPPFDGRELAIESAKIVDAARAASVVVGGGAVPWLSSHPDVVRGANVLELG